MSNVYRAISFIPTTTVLTTVYTCNATARAIINNIQMANVTGNHLINAYVYSSTLNTNYLVSSASIGANATISLLTGPIILQENDALLIQVDNTSVSGQIALMEVNRSAIAK